MKRRTNGKWSKKGSDKFITYIRVSDLTKEDLNVLEKYNLKQVRYVYVGQCGEWRVDYRNDGFVWDIKNRFSGNKDIHLNPDTARTYQNIMKFFREQKGMSSKQAEDYLFRSKECFYICRDGLEKQESKDLEVQIYNQLMVNNIFDKSFILLDNRDKQLEVERKDECINLKAKNKKVTSDNFKPVSVKMNFEMDIEKYKEFIDNNVIIMEEVHEKGKKITPCAANTRVIK